MKWWVWITWLFLFKIICSRLYQVHHKKNEKLATNPFTRIYINRINNRLMFKIKDRWYKLELRAPEIINLIGSTKK